MMYDREMISAGLASHDRDPYAGGDLIALRNANQQWSNANEQCGGLMSSIRQSIYLTTGAKEDCASFSGFEHTGEQIT